jgi:hypothetical protein
LREREFKLKRGWFKMFARELNGQLSIGDVGGLLLPPKGICPLRCQRSKHVWTESRTCPQRVTGIRPWHRTCPVLGLNPSYNMEARHVRCWDRICPVTDTITQFLGQISPAKNLVAAMKELTRHVWSRSWTCPIQVTRIRQWTHISSES